MKLLNTYGLGLSLLGLSLSFLPGDVCGQEQPSRRSLADKYYEKLEYYNAAKVYERLVDTKKPRLRDMERLASSYYAINVYDLAENWYSRVVAMEGASATSYLNYASTLKLQGKYVEAKAAYKAYSSKFPEGEDVSGFIVGADSAISWMRHPSHHSLRNESGINTSFSEFSLVPTRSGGIYAGEPSSHLGTKSGMTGASYLRVYSADLGSNDLLSNGAISEGSYNQNTYHVGPLAMNASGDELYVTRTYAGKDSEKFKSDGTRWRKQNLELILYKKNGDSWESTDFPYNKVESYSVGHASLSEDGKVLYFASDMPGGHGGVDLWYSERGSDGSWGTPVNLGSTINTSGDEMFPSVVGEKLYFSSTGHIGMGGLDIFESTGSKDVWGVAKNMGYPVNSASDDFSYVSQGDVSGDYRGYLSSNRQGGVGGDDIYSFMYKKPKITILLNGITKDSDSGAFLPGSTITLYSAAGSIVSKGVADGNGQVQFTIDSGIDYKLTGEKKDYHSDTKNLLGVTATRDTVVELVLHLKPVMKVGTKFVLEDIYYDFDKHFIRKDASIILDKLVATLRDNPTLKIELSSHTDSRGTHHYNEDLSQRRAAAAVEYIISRGISRDRLRAKGYGETRLVNKCSDGVSCTAAEHQANRRTEIEVLEI